MARGGGGMPPPPRAVLFPRRKDPAMFRTALLLGTLWAAGASAQDDKAKKDLEALQGTWEVEALEYNGKDVAGRYKFSFVFKGDVGTVEGNDAVKKEYAKVSIKLDPATTPPCIDMTILGGIQKDAVIEGIYRLQGDEL